MSRIYLIRAGTIVRHHAAALAILPPHLRLIVTDTNQAMLDDFLQQFSHGQLAADVPTMLADPAEPDDM